MQCMYCGSPDTRVPESVKTGKKVLRERTCKSCGKSFYTEETAADISRQYIVKAELRRVRELKGRKER